MGLNCQLCGLNSSKEASYILAKTSAVTLFFWSFLMVKLHFSCMPGCNLSLNVVVSIVISSSFLGTEIVITPLSKEL